MDKKIKILLIFLGMISLSGLALAVWIYFSAQIQVSKYAKQQTSLEERSAYLQNKLDVIQKEIDQWKEKAQTSTTALNKLGKEHVLLQNRLNSLTQDKDGLLKENKGLQEQLLKQRDFQVSELPKIDAGATDEFLSALLREKANLQIEVENLKEQIGSLEKQTLPTEEKFLQLNQEKSSLVHKLKEGDKVSDVLSNDLLQEKKKADTLEKELAKTENRLKSAVLEKDQMADQLDKLKQVLEQRLVELGRTKEILEGAVEGAKQVASHSDPEIASIELPPIVVKAEDMARSFPINIAQAKPAQPAKAIQETKDEIFELAGRVIKVNDKYKFVVIDIGKDDGVKKGMNFQVYRNDKEVGKIKVVETRKNIAACDIKEVSASGVKLNDIARR